MSSLKEKLKNIKILQSKYKNLTREEWSALCNLKNDKNIVIEGADNGSVVVVWDRDDYIKEAEKQLDDKDIHEDVCNDPGPLISTLLKTIEKFLKSWGPEYRYN